MKDKIFIELIVPDIEEIYNIYIPINKRIGNIIKLLNKAIYELTDGVFIGTNKIGLYNRETGVKYDINKLVRETDIRNGTVLVLLQIKKQNKQMHFFALAFTPLFDIINIVSVMMTMYNTYKFRLYPIDSQKELINKMFGCNRFIYNYYLDKIKVELLKLKWVNIREYRNINKTSGRMKSATISRESKD